MKKCCTKLFRAISNLDIQGCCFIKPNLSVNCRNSNNAKLHQKNKSEKKNGFIAGLTNVYEGQTFLFINNERFNGLEKEGLISHECLHLTRYLITFLDNSDIDFKDKTWWEKTKFTDIKDNNEELFAETLERCVDVVFTKLKKYI